LVRFAGAAMYKAKRRKEHVCVYRDRE
jgi:hypothetical protein